MVSAIIRDTHFRVSSLFELFLLLYHVLKVITVGTPEDWLDEGQHTFKAIKLNHFTVLKPYKILARLPLVCFTFKVIAWARVDEVLDISDVVVTSYNAVGIGSSDDVVVLIED